VNTAAATLRVIVEAQTGPASANLAKFDGQLEATAAKADAAMGRVAASSEKAAIASGRHWEATGRSITKVGKTIGLVAAPVALFGAAAVKMSIDFHKAMEMISTQAGASQGEVRQLEKAVLGLSRHSTQGPTELANALFRLEGAGLRGKKAMDALRASAKLATVGGADVEDTAKTLSQVWFTDIKGAEDFKRVVAEVNATVGAGDLRLPQLVDALGTGVLASAKQVGLSLKDVNGALAVFGDETNNVSGWSAQLATAFHFFTNPTEKATGALEHMGLTGNSLARDMHKSQGLITALSDLRDHLERLPGGLEGVQAGKTLGDILPGGRGRVLLVLLNQLERYEQKMVQIKGTTDQFGNAVRKTFALPGAKMERAWSSIRADMIETGDVLLPAVVPGFEHLVHLADVAMHIFTAMPPGLQSAAVEAGLIGIGLSGALIVTGKLVEAFGVLRGSMMGVAAANFASFVSGGVGDLRAAGALAMSGELGGFSMVGSEAAGALMGGLKRALPPLVAAAGLGDIVLTATHGDWGKVGAEAGGAVVGGIAGAFVGNPLLGVGLGAILGGLSDDLANSLFGGSDDKLASFQSGLSTDMDRLTGAAKVQKEAFEALANAGHKVAASHHRVHAAESRLAAAKRELKNTEEEFRGTRHLSISQAIQLARKEENVREAARQVAVAKRAEETVEKLQGVRRKITKRQLEQTVEVEKGVAERRAKQIGPLKHLLQYEENQGASRKRIIEIGKVLLADMEARQKALAKVNQAESEAATKISPQFAKHLEQLKSAEKQFSDAMARSTRNFERTHSLMQESDRLFGANRQAVGRTTQSYEHLKGVMGPFRAEFHTKLGYAMADAESWSKATKLGVSAVETRFHNFASKLGIANVHFDVKDQAPQKHQKGGFTVPGNSTGDQHPYLVPTGSFVMNRVASAAAGLQSGGMTPVMLESKETVFYPDAVARHGATNLAAWNARFPRFQKAQTGGSIGPEPVIVGPTGQLQSVGQAAVHAVYQGAQKYLSQHQPTGLALPGGGGSVVEQIGRVLFANGFNKIGAAGIIGNAYRESGWNPAAVGTGGGGLWGFTSGAISLAALQAAAGRAGVPWTDVPFQTGFMLRHGGMGLRNVLNHAGSAGDAARIFMEQWERPGIPALGEREAAARKALAMGYQQGGQVKPVGKALRHEFNETIRRIWPRAAPYYGHSAMPTTIVLDLPRGTAGEAVHTRHGKAAVIDRNAALGIVSGHEPGNPGAPAGKGTLLHEWSHVFQVPGLKTWEAEGGAEDFKLWAGPQIFGDTGAFGSRTRRYFDDAQKVAHDKGWPWVKYGQFGRTPQGQVHRQEGGLVLSLQKGGPTDAVHWAMRHLGSTDHWGYPGEWCGAFLAADMEAVGLTPPSGYPSAINWASYGSPLGRSHIQAGAILDYGSAHVAMAISSSEQIQGNNSEGKVGTSGIGGVIGGSKLTAVRWPPYATGPGAGSSLTEKVPGIFHGAHTKALSLSGAIPKTIGGVNREIARREKELHIYRRAAQLAGAKGMPKTQQAIQHNVTALEKRVSELRRALHKLRQEVAKKRISKHLGRSLGTVTGYEKLIEGKARTYNQLNEFASQTVDLEPQEAILSAGATEAQREAAEKLYVANLTSYIDSQERPAYQRVLEAEADWRNTILRAEIFGFGKNKPSAAHLEHRWEKGIRGVDSDIDAINAFTKKVSDEKGQWKSAHPKEDFPKWLKAAIKKDEAERERLPVLRFRDRELRKVLGEARGEFYPGVKDPIQPPTTPLAGTGTFESDLEDVQGVHWPDQHALGASIPGMRIKGHFGGAIWETQGAIEELGLKIQQASANIGGSGGAGTDDSEEIALLKEELLHERMGKGLRHIEEVVSGETPKPSQLGLPYAGAYASGGVVGALVGEKGPEIAAFPTGTRIHSARESASILKPNVNVYFYEGEGIAQVEVDGQQVEAIVNRMDRRSARGAARGMARAGF